MHASFDAQKFKSAMREQWDRHARGWDEHGPQIGDWLRQPTDAMLAMAEVRPGVRVIDIAAGAGEQTLVIAKKVGAAGRVLATDLSPAILALAERNAAATGCANVETLLSDGENLNVSDEGFDVAVCRLGAMFFPDPATGLREMFRVLKPGGRACTMVFSTPEANPCVSILIKTALKHAGLPPRDPYQPGGLLSLGKPGLIDELFHRAGFVGVATTRLPAPFRLPSVEHYLDFVRSSASPIVQIMDRFAEADKEAAWEDIRAKLRAFDTPDGWEGPNELLLTVGRRP